MFVLDVRDPDEYQRVRIPGSVNIPYGHLVERLGELPSNGTAIATVCSGGKRSGLAASLLKREGYEHVIHVAGGGVGTWRNAGHEVEEG
jgi:hydroxyacylglutathione hydrolase